MTDDTIPAMHRDFPNWYKAIGLGDEQERRDSGWAAVSTMADSVDGKDIETLIRLAFDSKQIPTAAGVQRIRETFNSIDTSIEMQGNTREIQVLAGATLATLIGRGGDTGSLGALAISTASMDGARSPNLPMDLGVLAEAALDQISENGRRRPNLSGLLSKMPPKVDLQKAAEDANEERSFESLAAEAINKAMTALARHQSDIARAVGPFLRMQDEELQMLWWLIGEHSEDLDCNFGSIAGDIQPLVFAKELAGHTEILPGPASIKGLLSRAGLKQRGKFQVSKSIDAADTEWLHSFIPEEEVSPVTMPIHFGLKRRLETGSGEAWIASWAAAIGIEVTHKISKLELGTLFYRERLLQQFGDL